MKTIINLLSQAFIIFLALLACTIYLNTWELIEVAGDDGFELSKAYTLCLIPDQVSAMWNDQPWLHTIITAQLFEWFGFQAFIPRLISMVACAVMTASCMSLFPPYNARIERVLTACLLFLWPETIRASLAGMLEMPALGLATTAAAIGLSGVAGPRRGFLWICSGGLFAASIHIKLVAAMIMPAFFLSILWQLRVKNAIEQSIGNRLSWHRSSLHFVLLWSVSFGVVFIALTSISPNWSWKSLWTSHQEAGKFVNTTMNDLYAFPISQFLSLIGAVTAASLGIIVAVKRTDFSFLIFPLALLVTVFLIHLSHRPWWPYYNIHFAPAFAILGGYGIGAAIKAYYSSFKPAISNIVVGRFASIKTGLLALTAGVALALVIGFQLPVRLNEWSSIGHQPRINQSLIIRLLRGYSHKVTWLYTRESAYAFHGHILMPPELVVLPRKRFWSGEITETAVFETVRRYEPELLLLIPTVELTQSRWRKLVESDYDFIAAENGLQLFAAKRLME